MNLYRVKRDKAYALWKHMFDRSYNKEVHKLFPSYVGCTVAKDFENFECFFKWCLEQVGFCVKGYHMDKDILSKEKKIYSPTTCVFVTQEINYFFIRNKHGKYQTGVYFDKDKKKYGARITIENRHKKLGYFDNEWSAFIVYKKAKEQRAKELAEKWKDSIDKRVYDKLISYNLLLTN